MAGLNNLMLGLLPDRLGKSVRSSPDGLALIWDLAKESRDQTEQFVESDRPINAVWVFDFAMAISNMNNLLNLTAKSKDSLSLAYSAGVSSNCVYKSHKAV